MFLPLYEQVLEITFFSAIASRTRLSGSLVRVGLVGVSPNDLKCFYACNMATIQAAITLKCTI